MFILGYNSFEKGAQENILRFRFNGLGIKIQGKNDIILLYTKLYCQESLRLKALERKQRSMENKVEEQEKKLADFAAKLSARKNKV